MTIRIEPVDVHDTTEATLRGMHDAYAARNADLYPDDPPLTFDYHKANWLAPNGIHRNEQQKPGNNSRRHEMPLPVVAT